MLGLLKIKSPMALCAVIITLISITAFYTHIIFCVLMIFIICSALLLLKINFKTVILSAIFISYLISLLTASTKIQYAETLSGEYIPASFTVTEQTYKTKYGYSTTVKLNSGDLKNSKCILYSENNCFDVGKNYTAVIKIKPIKNYRASRFAENIFCSASLYSDAKNIGSNNFTTFTNGIKQYINTQLYKNLNRNEAATLNALTIGDKSTFTEKFALSVRHAGVSHIMVVSGLHLSVIMGGISLLIDSFFKNRFIKFLISIISVFTFAAICGFSMSIIRAGITFVLSSAAPLFKRKSEPINTLGTTLIIVLISSPFAIFSISFILSLLSTFGILYLTPNFLSKIKKGIIKGILTPIILSISATAVTLPVTIYSFEEISPIAPITNLFLSFSITYTLLIAVVALILGRIPIINILSKPLYWVCGTLTKYINNIITFFGNGKGIFEPIKNDYFIVFLALTIILILIKYACNRRKYLLELKISKKKRK